MGLSFYDRMRAGLGKVPNVEAKPRMGWLKRNPETREFRVKYDWIKDWAAVEGLDFSDGQEWIIFYNPEKANG